MDVFDVLDAQRKFDAENWLTQINVQSIPYMEKEEFQKFVGGLRKEAGFTTERAPMFDEAGFEALKMQLKTGT